MLRREAEYFAVTYRVIAPDLIGHGSSARLHEWPDEYWYANAVVMLALCSALGCGPVHVVGTSGGAIIGLHMAHESPAVVRSVVADSFVGTVLTAELAEGIRRERQQVLAGPAREFWREMQGPGREAVVGADTAMLLRCTGKGGLLLPRGLKNVRCPVLLTASLADYMIGDVRTTFDKLARELPDAQVELFPSGGIPPCSATPMRSAREWSGF